MSSSAPSETRQQSTADLVRQASDQLTTLVRDELRLARAELKAKGTHAGIGAGLFGGGGLFALYGMAALAVAAGLALALVIPGWAAALVVGGALLMLAGLLALIGRGEVRRATPAMPQATANSVRADLDVLNNAAHDGRRRR